MPAPDFVSLIEIAIEPKVPVDRGRLLDALSEMTARESSISFHVDESSDHLILGGVSELSLDGFIDQIINRRGIPVLIGQPRVAYRESISKDAIVDYTHRKRVGPTIQYARVKLAVRPGKRNSGFTFDNEIVGGSIPREFIPAVEKGVKDVMDAGPLIGFPVLDVAVELIDGAYHEVDSSATSFEIAARTAMRDALLKAGPKLLEPIMAVEVVSPEAFIRKIISELHSRRAQMRLQEARGDAMVVQVLVPLDKMFGFESALRTLTNSRATWTMVFSHYAQPPPPDEDPGRFPPAVGMRG